MCLSSGGGGGERCREGWKPGYSVVFTGFAFVFVVRDFFGSHAIFFCVFSYNMYTLIYLLFLRFPSIVYSVILTLTLQMSTRQMKGGGPQTSNWDRIEGEKKIRAS